MEAFTLKSNRTFYWLLLGIILLGLFLRLHQLDTESFWTDEAFSVTRAQQPSPELVITAVSQTEAAPPGYYLLLHYWMQAGGNTVFVIRLLSVVFSVLSIIMLWKVVRLLFNIRIALLASLFMATAMLQIEYAQEARLYTLFTLLSLGSAYFFARWYKYERRTDLWWYGLFTLLAMYVNYLAAFLILGFTFMVFSRKELLQTFWKPWIVTHSIIGLFCLPLVPVLLSQFRILNTGLSDSLINKGLPAVLANLGLFFFLLPLLGFTLLAAIIISQKKVRNIVLWLDTYFFVLVLVMGFLYLYLARNPFIISGIPFIRVPLTNSYFLVRHSFFLVPLWYVYLGYKIDQWWSGKRKYLTAFVFLLILFFSFSALWVYYAQSTKAQWQEVTVYISERSITEPLILLDKGGYSNEFLLRYYYPGNFSLLKLTWSESRRNLRQMTDSEVLEGLSGYDEFWLILAKNNDERYKELLDQQYYRDDATYFYGVEVYRYTSRPGYYFPMEYNLG